MNLEVVVEFVDRLSGPARAAAESLNMIRERAEGLSAIGESMTRATAGLRNAGTMFKTVGEGAEKLAGGLRAVEGLTVAPKLTALAEASERLAAAGGRMRTAGTGAVELASGLKAVDAVSADHLGVLAGAVERLSKASGEGTTARDLKTMGSSIDGAAGGAEKLAGALGQVQERLSAISAAGTIEPLRAVPPAAGAAPAPAPTSSGPWHRPVPGQTPGTSVPTMPPAPSAPAAPGINLAGTRYYPRAQHGFAQSIMGAARHHMASQVAMAVTPMPHGNIYGAAGHFFEEGGDLDAALTTMRMNGISSKDIAETVTLAQDVSRRVPQTNIAQNVRGIMEARLALSGNLQGAQRFYETAAKAGQVVGFAQHDVGGAAKFADSIYDMLRAGELANYVSDPAKLNNFMEGAVRTAVYSEGKVSPKAYHMTAVYLRGALQGLSEEFYTNQLPFLMQELQTGKGAGGQAGSAIAQMAATVSRATIAKKDVPEWVRLGLADGSKVDEKGILASDGVINRMMQQQNPFDYAGFINDQLEAHGYKSKEDKLGEINRISGNQKFKQALEILILQADRLREFQKHQAEVGSIDANYAAISNTYQGSLDALKGQAGSFAQTAGGYVQGLAVNALHAGTRFLSGATSDLGGGGTGQDPEPGHPMGSQDGPIVRAPENLPDLGGKLAGMVRLGSAAVESPVVQLLAKATAAISAPVATGIAAAAGPLLSRLPGAGVAAGVLPWLARLQTAANPWLTAAWAAGEFGGYMAQPHTLGLDPHELEPRQRAIDAANLARRTGTDYASAGPDILPVMGTPGSGITAPVQAPAAPIVAPPTVKPPEPIKLPDATAAGAAAGGQIAAGVASQAGAVQAQAEAMMATIRAVLGGGVDIPVHLQTPAIPGAPAAAGAAPAGGEKHAALSPAVHAGATGGQHVASAAPVTHIDNRKTSVVVHVAASDSPKDTAKAVHDAFKTAARSQLSDGVFS